MGHGLSKPRMAPEGPGTGFAPPPAWNTKRGCTHTFSRGPHPLESSPPRVGAPAARCWESLLSGVPTAQGPHCLKPNRCLNSVAVGTTVTALPSPGGPACRTRGQEPSAGLRGGGGAGSEFQQLRSYRPLKKAT